MSNKCPVCIKKTIHETHFACGRCIKKINNSVESEYTDYLAVLCRSIFPGLPEEKLQSYVKSFNEKFPLSIIADQLDKLRTLFLIDELSELGHADAGQEMFDEFCDKVDQQGVDFGEALQSVGAKGASSVPFAYNFKELGFELIIHDHTSIAWYLLASNKSQSHFLHENITEGECVIDCGAHYGFYSLSMAKKVGPTGKVIAIEGDPYNYAVLCENIKLNNATNIIPVHAIVSNESGNELLFQGDTVTEGNLRDGHFKSVMVKTVKIDDFINEKPTFLKIDIEGYELMALRGSEQVMKLLKPKMDISIHLYGAKQPDMRNFGFKPSEVLDVLQSNGYQLGDDFSRRLSDDNCAPCGYDINL
ncbi:MAG: hypothetical protein COA78_19555 [Blastopirellula sp.]|nr:MAG: hypothetical protein COA78_19555 [Blastopirellula sp.]